MKNHGDTVLSVTDLRVAFKDRDLGCAIPVVRGISFSIGKGERMALAGESGCGKSMTSLAITRLPPTDDADISGEILFKGLPIDRATRGIAYIFQDPIASLNPVMKIGTQVLEALPAHWHKKRKELRTARIIELFTQVDLPTPEALLKAYPCELSGGMCQRVMIAMALASEPELLIADEPTTALDVTTQADVMDLIERISKEQKMALLLSTHNLGLARGRCDSLCVLYAGEIVETGKISQVLTTPRHPYTQSLMNAIPRIESGRRNRLRDIPGMTPSAREITAMRGCTFRPRCAFATADCETPVHIVNGVRCLRTQALTKTI